ncbi:unnamed protein product [Rotaria socialis]|uniref:Protein kinase domain-containing protein n=2 Tax=Rotaria socialis TaxID=392032 RepID=A0A821L906_9BILA|nr:unnamed protein product [Rotaria socialis]
MSESDEPNLTYDIDWPMLDKSRFIPLNLLSTFIVRSVLYPVTLVRTRLQVQVKSSIYRGTWHALRTTIHYEGYRSLYKGFLVYNCQLVPGLIYITTFEATRARANILTTNEYLSAGIGGIVGSMCSQILACPIDIVSQHMQLVGLSSSEKKSRFKDDVSSKSSSGSLKNRHVRRIHVPKEIRHSNYLIFKHICSTLYYEKNADKNSKSKISFKGFYRGYLVSTFLFSLTSGVWWPSYYFYQRQMLNIESMFPIEVPLLLIQCIAGALSSFTSTIATNPIDVCRTRVQVERERRRVPQIMRELWQEERFHIFTKGLTARLSHSCIYSLLIIFGYETVKRVSLKEEYQGHVRWYILHYILIMVEEHQQIENLPVEQPRWIGGSTLVRQFEDFYDLDEPINHGQFADVYTCRLKNRQAIRAVKCIPKRGKRKTPIKNASIIIQLDHPNLVVIREILESPTHIYIVQDFVDGPNLFQKIAQTEVHTEFNISKYCSQILRALQYLHERKIYHGRIHVENVLFRTIDNEEKVCLVDYTYSNLCTRQAIAILVNDSPIFCAPEILRGETFSASSDMWQLGILLYLCLSGSYPFAGSAKQIFQKILNGKIGYDAPEWDCISSNGKAFISNIFQVNVQDRLTVLQALSQPWIREKVYHADNLSQARTNIMALETGKK